MYGPPTLSGGPSRTARIAWIVVAVLAVFVAWVAVAAPPLGPRLLLLGPDRPRRLVVRAASGAARRGLPALRSSRSATRSTRSGFRARVRRSAASSSSRWRLVVSWIAERLRVLEHSAEELEAIRAALTPADLPDLPDLDAGGRLRPLRTRGLRRLLPAHQRARRLDGRDRRRRRRPRSGRRPPRHLHPRPLAAFAANTSDPAELLRLANRRWPSAPAGGTSWSAPSACACTRASNALLGAGGAPAAAAPAGAGRAARDGSTFLLGAEEGLELENTGVPRWRAARDSSSTPTAPPTSAAATRCSGSRDSRGDAGAAVAGSRRG